MKNSNGKLRIPAELQAFVKQQMTRRRFKSAESYLRFVLEQERRRVARRELEQRLLTAIKGPFTEMTPAVRAEIESKCAQVIQRSRRRKAG